MNAVAVGDELTELGDLGSVKDDVVHCNAAPVPPRHGNLTETRTGTNFTYSGELGTDLWRLGKWWADRVAQQWERTVADCSRSSKPKPSDAPMPAPQV
jgi:hypothetical protein